MLLLGMRCATQREDMVINESANVAINPGGCLQFRGKLIRNNCYDGADSEIAAVQKSYQIHAYHEIQGRSCRMLTPALPGKRHVENGRPRWQSSSRHVDSRCDESIVQACSIPLDMRIAASAPRH